jgi:hypothetical protein
MKGLAMQTWAAVACALPIWAGTHTLDIPLDVLTKPVINQVSNLTLTLPSEEAVGRLQQ